MTPRNLCDGLLVRGRTKLVMRGRISEDKLELEYVVESGFLCGAFRETFTDERQQSRQKKKHFSDSTRRSKVAR